MAIIYPPQILIGNMGEVLVQTDRALDHQTLYWDVSFDGGNTWSDYTFQGPVFSPAEANPEATYRVRLEDRADVRYNELTFALGETVREDGVVTTTLERFATAFNGASTTVLQLDKGNAFGWTSIREESTDRSISVRIDNDEGYGRSEVYSIESTGERELVYRTRHDDEDIRGWQEIAIDLVQDTRIVKYDDGRIRTTFPSDDSGSLIETWRDSDDLYDWQNRKVTKRLDGSEYHETDYDNGIYVVLERGVNDDGQEVLLKLQYDRQNVFGWSEFFVEYLDGSVVSENIFYDNGVSVIKLFEKNEIGETTSQSIAFDNDDNFSWSSYSKSYVDGNLVTEGRDFDSGVVFQGIYGNETTLDGSNYYSQKYFEDRDDFFDWLSHTTTTLISEISSEQSKSIEYSKEYDDGSFVTNNWTYHNEELVSHERSARSGVTSQSFFENGMLTRRESQDVLNAHDWDERYFDSHVDEFEGAARVRDYRSVTYDDGTSYAEEHTYLDDQLVYHLEATRTGVIRRSEFEDGVLVTRHLSDTDNVRPWTEISEEWEDGVRTSRSVVMDEFEI